MGRGGGGVFALSGRWDGHQYLDDGMPREQALCVPFCAGAAKRTAGNARSGNDRQDRRPWASSDCIAIRHQPCRFCAGGTILSNLSAWTARTENRTTIGLPPSRPRAALGAAASRSMRGPGRMHTLQRLLVHSLSPAPPSPPVHPDALSVRRAGTCRRVVSCVYYVRTSRPSAHRNRHAARPHHHGSSPSHHPPKTSSPLSLRHPPPSLPPLLPAARPRCSMPDAQSLSSRHKSRESP